MSRGFGGGGGLGFFIFPIRSLLLPVILRKKLDWAVVLRGQQAQPTQKCWEDEMSKSVMCRILPISSFENLFSFL